MRATSEKYRLNSYDGEELPFENYMKLDNTNPAPDEVAKMITIFSYSTIYSEDGEISGEEMLRDENSVVENEAFQKLELDNLYNCMKSL